MNMRQLETFFWAAKLGTFTAAADRLKATQSTVSMRIKELERDLGILLFDRRQRTPRLTTSGRSLLPHADKMLRQFSEMREHVGHPDLLQGVLRLGVAEVISITWLPRLLKQIHQRFPRLVVELDEALTQDLVTRLQAGSLDLILTPGRVVGYNSSAMSLGYVHFVWMASPDLPLPRKRMGPRDLQDWPVVALARESYHHRSIEKWFRSGNASCHRVDTCKSLGVAASLAAAGIGLTLLPVQSFRDELSRRRLRIVDTVPSPLPVEFTATVAIDSLIPLAHRVARLAQKVSDFPGNASIAKAATRRHFPS
jgi:DNA-binding transcriptional LysR family regulator